MDLPAAFLRAVDLLSEYMDRDKASKGLTTGERFRRTQHPIDGRQPKVGSVLVCCLAVFSKGHKSGRGQDATDLSEEPDRRVVYAPRIAATPKETRTNG